MFLAGKDFFLAKILITIILSLSIVNFAYAAPLFQPGETLDPNCLPTDPDCKIITNSGNFAASGINSDITQLSALTNATTTNIRVNNLLSAFSGIFNSLSVTGSSTISGNLNVSGNVFGSNLNISNWNSAFSWGDHSLVGYIKNLSSFTTDNLTEGSSNLYFSNSKARNSISSSAPINYNSGTGQISINKASSTSNGYLSSSDWSIFNNKVSSQWITNGSDVSYSAGKVGIGTTSPYSALSIQGNAPAITLADNVLTNQVWQIRNGGLTEGTTAFDIFDKSSNQSRLAFKTNGEMLVGTTSNVLGNGSRMFIYGGATGANVDAMGDPSVMFGDQAVFEAEGADYGVNGNINSIAIRYFGAGGFHPVIAGVSTNNLAVLDFGTASSSVIRTVNNTPIIFGIDNIERMRLTSNGLGIGTTSPYSKLSVAGQVVAQNYIATSTSISSIFPKISTTELSVSKIIDNNSSAGLSGYVLQSNGNNVQWVSTSSLGIVGGVVEGGSGSVTSVNASGGSTGLTFSGGPITNSGTLTLGGVLGVSNGGTGLSNIAPGFVLFGSSSGGFATSSNISVDSITGALSVPALNITGGGTSTINGNFSITGDIIPTSNEVYSLGSVTKAWKDLYVGPGSIYVNGQEVLHTDESQNVNVTADINQSLNIGTFGTGNIVLNPSGTGQILLEGNMLLSANKHLTNSNATAINFLDGILAENIEISGNTIQAKNTNGGISLTPNGNGGVYVTNGNFGVGTTTPSSPLSVVGQIYTTGGIKFLDGTTQTTSATGIWNASGSDIYFYSPSGGNVGIGAAVNPSYKLDVTGTGRFTGNLMTGGLVSTGYFSSIAPGGAYHSDTEVGRLDATGSSNPYLTIGSTGSGTGGYALFEKDNHAMRFGLHGSDSYFFRFSSEGARIAQNVGNAIGSMDGALSVWPATASTKGLVITPSGVNNYSANLIELEDQLGNPITIFDKSGHLGIGTTSASSSLSVVGDINLTGAIKINGSYGSNGTVLQSTGTGLQWVSTSSIFLGSGSGPSGYVNDSNWLGAPLSLSNGGTGQNFSTSSGLLYLNNGVATSLSTSSLNISGNSQWNTNGSSINYTLGNVGVGISNPSVPLHVNGAIQSSSWQDGTSLIATYDGRTTFRKQTGGVVEFGVSPNVNQVADNAVLKIYGTDYGADPSNWWALTFDTVGVGTLSGQWSTISNTSNAALIAPNVAGSQSLLTHPVIFGIGNSAGTLAEAIRLTPGTTPSVSILNGTVYANNGGNVGIGTSSPSQKLSVAGTVYSSGGFMFPDGTTQVTSATGQWTTSGNDVYSNNSGNIGIGTSSPKSKLEIYSSDGNLLTMGSSLVPGKQRFLSFQDGTNVQWRTNIAADDTTRDVPSKPAYAMAVDAYYDTGLSLFRWPVATGTFQQIFSISGNSLELKNASNTTRFYIDQLTGNAGFGTSTFASSLLPSFANNKYIFEGKGGTNSTFIDATSSSNISLVGGTESNIFLADLGTTTGKRNFNINNNDGTLSIRRFNDSMTSALSTPFAINSSDYVGIGTANPKTPLEVYSSVANASRLRISSNSTTAGNYDGLEITGRGGVASAFAGGLFREEATDRIGIWDYSSEKISLANGGVGIGTTSPSFGAKLSVSANAAASPYTGIHLGSDSPTAFTAYSIGRTGIDGYWAVAGAPNNYITGSVAGDTAILGNGGKIHFGTFGGSSPVMTITTGAGNVGIGTTSPSSLLSVAGDINLTGAIKANGNSGSSGTILQSTGTGFQWVSTSSLNISAVSSQWVTNGSNINYSTGNVGIGSSSPSQKLSVAGTVYSTGGFMFPDGTTQVTSATGQWTTSGNNIYLGASGNVGIGTTSPQSKFTISSATGGISPSYAPDVLIQGPGAGFYMQNTGTGSGFGSVGVGGTTGNLIFTFDDNKNLVFQTYDGSAYSSKFHIDGTTGYVGMGTSSPSQKLSVAGTIYSTGGFMFPDGTTQVTSAAGLNLWSTSGSNIYYNSGNIGIGTTTPLSKLEIVSEATTTLTAAPLSITGAYIANGNARFPFLVRDYNGTLRSPLGLSNDSNVDTLLNLTLAAGSKFKFIKGGDASTTLMALDSNGNLGIGTSSPSQKLELNKALASGEGVYTQITDQTFGTNIKMGNYYTPASQSFPGIWLNQSTPDATNFTLLSGTTNNTMLNTPSGQSLSLRVGNATKMIIDSSGNVGIGTSSPSQKLSVAGPIYTTGGVIFPDGTTQTTSATGQWTTNGNNIYSGNSGSVSLGTTSATAKLVLSSTAQTGYREPLFRGVVSDAPNAGFFINNGTIVDGVFAPSFAGISNSSTLWGQSFTGFTTATEDASDSSPYGLIDFAAMKTTSYSDPFNGTLSSVSNRKLFTFRGMDTNSIFMAIGANGNVGIGTSSPSQKLELNKALASGEGVYTQITDQTFGTNIKIGNYYMPAFQSLPGIWLNQSAPDTTNFAFLAGLTNNTIFNTPSGQSLSLRVGNATKMIIDSSGNVGIGTSSPVSKLSISSATGGISPSYTPDVLIQGPGAGFYMQNTGAGSGFGSVGVGGTTGNLILTFDNDKDLVFQTYDGSAYSSKFNIDGTTGYVGIGTSTPMYFTTVASSTNAPVLAIQGGVSTGYSQMAFMGNSRIYQLGVGNSGESGLSVANKFYLYDTGSSSMRFVIDSSGNLRLPKYGAGSLQTDASGNVTVSSDERLKDIQGNFSRGLSAINLINPIEFKWKKSTGFDTENIYSGFSAQNIKNAIPEAVGTDGDGYLTLQDRPIIAALVNAVKELSSKMKDIVNNSVTSIEGTFNKLSTGELTVGSEMQASGITIYDRITKRPFCIEMVNGSMETTPGKCSEISVSNNENNNNSNSGNSNNNTGTSTNTGTGTNTDTGTSTSTTTNSTNNTATTTSESSGTGTTTEILNNDNTNNSNSSTTSAQSDTPTDNTDTQNEPSNSVGEVTNPVTNEVKEPEVTTPVGSDSGVVTP